LRTHRGDFPTHSPFKTVPSFLFPFFADFFCMLYFSQNLFYGSRMLRFFLRGHRFRFLFCTLSSCKEAPSDLSLQPHAPLITVSYPTTNNTKAHAPVFLFFCRLRPSHMNSVFFPAPPFSIMSATCPASPKLSPRFFPSLSCRYSILFLAHRFYPRSGESADLSVCSPLFFLSLVPEATSPPASIPFLQVIFFPALRNPDLA